VQAGRLRSLRRKRGDGGLFAALAVGLVALLVTPSCSDDASTVASHDSATQAPDGAWFRGATWDLVWDREGVEWRRDGWSVVTNLGYRVDVTTGWLVNYSVSLGSCDSAATSRRPFFDLGIRNALAHATDDPSTLTMQHAENLARPEDSTWWSTAFPAQRYCRAHWLVARATAAVDAPPEAMLPERSLQLQGAWSRGTKSGLIDIDTWWPRGTLRDLSAITPTSELAHASEANEPASVVSIRVERTLRTLFDGIDFETESAAVIADAVLVNVTARATMRAHVWSPENP
jgi:hypothetical protein